MGGLNIDIQKIASELNAQGHTQADSRQDPKAWVKAQMERMSGGQGTRPAPEPPPGFLDEPVDAAGLGDDLEPAPEPVSPGPASVGPGYMDLFQDGDGEQEDEERFEEPEGLDAQEEPLVFSDGDGDGMVEQSVPESGPDDLPDGPIPVRPGPEVTAEEAAFIETGEAPEPAREPEKTSMSRGRAPAPEKKLPPARKPAGSRPRKPSDKSLQPRTKEQAASLGVVQIPGFPKSLMMAIRADLPAATNNTDALAAWVYAKSGGVGEVPENIKALAATYSGEQDMQLLRRMDVMLDRVARTLNEMSRDHTNFELALVYLIIERMNLVDHPNIEGFDVTIPAVEELRRILHRQGSQVQRVDKDQKGRPIR